MQTLVIPDIHQQIDKAQAFLTLFENEVDRVIFLGDYFDQWPNITHTSITDTCIWLRNTHERLGAKATFLCGNHDLPYIEDAVRFLRNDNDFVIPTTKKHFICSGYTPNKSKKIKSVLGKSKYWDFFKSIQLSTTSHQFTLSHAGFHPSFFKPYSVITDDIANANNLFTASINDTNFFYVKYHSKIWEVGHCRGGDIRHIGGPLWLDWYEEFEVLYDLPQIVGHTHVGTPKNNHNSFCIDTNCNYCALITTNGYVEFYDTNGKLWNTGV